MVSKEVTLRTVRCSRKRPICTLPKPYILSIEPCILSTEPLSLKRIESVSYSFDRRERDREKDRVRTLSRQYNARQIVSAILRIWMVDILHLKWRHVLLLLMHFSGKVCMCWWQVATPCNILQHNATHTATHCNTLLKTQSQTSTSTPALECVTVCRSVWTWLMCPKFCKTARVCLCCRVLQSVAECCRVLQSVAECCRAL